MHFFDASPETVELLMELFGFIEEHSGAGEKVEDGAIGSGDGRVEFPAGKNGDSASADGGFHNFFRARLSRTNDALAGEARVDRGQQVIADRSFGERQKQRFVHGSGRALRGGIEPANRVDFVAEEFDAHRALGFGGVDVEDAAAQGILARHLDDVGGTVSNCVQVRE